MKSLKLNNILSVLGLRESFSADIVIKHVVHTQEEMKDNTLLFYFEDSATRC